MNKQKNKLYLEHLKNLDEDGLKELQKKKLKEALSYKKYCDEMYNNYNKKGGSDPRHVFIARNKEFIRQQYEKLMDTLLNKKPL